MEIFVRGLPQESFFARLNPCKSQIMILDKIKRFIGHIFRRPEKITWKEIVIWTGAAIAGLLILGFFVLALLVAILSIGLPDVHDLDKLNVSQSTTIYDREGNVMYVKHGGENRQYVSYDNISENIINATVAIEDDQFWTHSGFDVVGTARAFVNNVFHFGTQQGGSTITQQYIKNTFLSSEKSYVRKLKELILAVRLEQTYDKKKILELYLNKIPYGNNAYGVEKASQIYFDKHAKDLDLAESAILAALPQAPSHYNPFGPNRYSRLAVQFAPEDLQNRKILSEGDLDSDEFVRGLIGKNYKIDATHSVYIQGRTDLVLKSMEKHGGITTDEKDKALAELQKITFNDYHEQINHPHFVFQVLGELEDKYGKEVVEQGGLQVYTTLDPNLQDIAETAVSEGAKKNDDKYNAKNASLVAIDPKTGEILAMVGSRDYFDKEIDGAVNVAEQYRQPGSSFKPFVYSQAFYNRYAPGSIVFDTETKLGDSAYPKDFDGKFWGPMPIRRALGQSRNIPAIKAYFLAGEQEPIKQLAEKMGIVFMDRSRDYGWPLALGAAEVRLVDMVSAFGVFATDGTRHKSFDILKVQNANGDVLEEFKPDAPQNAGEEVLDPQVAYLINSILSDTGVRLSENMTVPGHVNAAKTGTSNRKEAGNKYYPHDLWCIGYTPSLVAGVWTGNNRDDEGHISTAADGTNVAAPIWKRFMTEALKDKPSENFTRPAEIRDVQVSTLTGKLPGPNTPPNQIKTEVYASFSVPTEIDDSYTTAEVDTRNNKLSNEYCPPDFVAKKSFLNLHDIAPMPEWEKGAQEWLQSHAGEAITGPAAGTAAAADKTNTGTSADASSTGIIFGQPPTETSELCTVESLNSKPEIRITSPAASEKIPSGGNINVEISAKAQNGLDKVEYYLDKKLLYTSDQAPYYGKIRLPKGESGDNSHTITARAIDKYGYAGESDLEIITTDALDNNLPPSPSNTQTTI
jgi:membrane peptidoglycan carboxypeptidase